MILSRVLFASAAAFTLAACSQPETTTAKAPEAAKPASAPPATPQDAPAGLTLQAINGAQFTPPGGDSDAAQNGNATTEPDNETNGYDTPAASNATGPVAPGDKTPSATLIRAEVLLDRANFAPGVIDGRMGGNMKDALVAYDKAHGITPSTTLDQATWQALTGADGTPVLKRYTLTSQDVAGPWAADVGEDFVKMSQQPTLGYTSALEMLSERFHMDQGLMKTLNPQADLTKAGTVLTVVDPGAGQLAKVDHILVDKHTEQVTAFGEDGKLLAVFPATVGSTERPSPKGTWKVKGVAQNPDYVYNPAKLTWGPKKAGKLHIPPGPNNPVGQVWIALTAPDYGIHGTPDPHTIGKTASHGCVRLTNWDAEELSKAVRPGVKVTFTS